MGNRLDMFLEVTGGEELYRVKKTEGEGCTCKIEKQVLEGNLPIGYCLFPQCEMVGIKLKLYNFKSTLFPL